jgi:hypothetical protein
MGFSRREFVALAGLGWLWPPNWFRPRVSLAGIEFRLIRQGPPVRHYLWIHGDEQTAQRVLQVHMQGRAGRAFLIRNEGQRNVPFSGGLIDPNRMFSQSGAAKNLRRLNPEWSEQRLNEALERLDRQRDEFLSRLLPPGDTILIALHNNSPAYSVTDEVPISNAVALKSPSTPDEFLLCTDPNDYAVLAQGPYNVVLQNRASGEDDGSLSRLCAERRIRYVNIEAAHGNGVAQRNMLQYLESALR